MKRMACAVALAASAGFGLVATTQKSIADPLPLSAASGLQLSVAPESTFSADQTALLHVGYQGGKIESIGLWIDGGLIQRKPLNTRSSHGTITFELDPTLLPAGDHEIVIKATDAVGNIASTLTHLHISPETTGGPSRLLFPHRNATLQGVVPIEVQVDPSIHAPYVTFIVDHDFLLLSNFPPFTYNWDSTRAANGPHTIVIEILDGDTQAKVKTITMSVNVNNPGGLTRRERTTPDLAQRHASVNPGIANVLKSKSAPVTSITDRLFAAPDFNPTEIDPMGPQRGDARFGVFGAPDHRVDSNRPNRHTSARLLFGTGKAGDSALATLPKELMQPSAPTNSSGALAGFTAPDHLQPAVKYGNVTRPGALGLFAMPRDLVGFSRSGLLDHITTQPLLRPRHGGNFAALPQEETRQASGASVGGLLLTRRVGANRALRVLHGPGAVAGHGHTLAIAFDNTQIAFDVPPRVEHGLPLAPFRQIFEHTGGTVSWYGHSRTVRAVNSSREIEFRVGHRGARVNNHVVKMGATPYIDRGRTIVPLSFVRDALNVDVHYDAASGHLRIESKK